MDDNTGNAGIPTTSISVRDKISKIRNKPQINLGGEIHIDNKVEVEDDSDWTTSVYITRHFSLIRSGSESFVHPIYPPGKRYPAPWEVDIAFLPNYLTKINPKLDGLLYVGTNMEQSAESFGRKSAAAAPPPLYIEDGGSSLLFY